MVHTALFTVYGCDSSVECSVLPLLFADHMPLLMRRMGPVSTRHPGVSSFASFRFAGQASHGSSIAVSLVEQSTLLRWLRRLRACHDQQR